MGGGINAVGTSQRYGSGALNVLEYTMVDAEGHIIKASENNVTILNSNKNRYEQVTDSNHLYRSLQLAGSSFGVVTEFHYRIFEGPELMPAIALAYIDDKKDLWNFQKAGLDGRYQISLHVSYWFTPLNWLAKERRSVTFFRLLIKILPILQFHRSRPVIVAIVDNFPTENQHHTDKEDAYKFLEGFGVKLAVKGKLSDMYQPGSEASYQDYESVYQTTQQRKRSGPRPIISANFMNLTNINSIDQILMKHPLFGLQNYGSRRSARLGCEYCLLAVVISNVEVFKKTPSFSEFRFTPFEEIQPNDVGNFQIELSCLYKPNTKSKCPNIVKKAKYLMVNSATRAGEKLTQYYNTPSCDSNSQFKNRYWSERNNEILLRAKRFWDPQNIFNHCHSVGSTTENCCPPDA